MTLRWRTASAALVFALLGQTACFTVEGVAPHGPDVVLIPGDEPVEVARRYQKWYAIWGIFDLTPSANPRDIIKREELVEVRVYTEDAVEDAISGFFYTLLFPAGIILPQTVVVEGNRAPTDRTSY
jgi:hypothetical protein